MPALTNCAMDPYPWFAATTSGGLSPDSASRSVFCRSGKDRDTRLIVTFGYLAWNAVLSLRICSFWPPRTSWSHTVRVTGPSREMSVLTAPGALDAGLTWPEPGAHAVARAATVTSKQTLRRTDFGMVCGSLLLA